MAEGTEKVMVEVDQEFLLKMVKLLRHMASKLETRARGLNPTVEVYLEDGEDMEEVWKHVVIPAKE